MEYPALPHGVAYPALPHGVEYPAILCDPEELVGCSDGVDVGPETVMEEGIRLPESLQHLDVEGQLGQGACPVA